MSAGKICCVLVLAVLTASGALAGPLEGYVLTVEDGNTFTIAHTPEGRQPEAVVRFYGIEAPTLQQPLGPEARVRLAELLPRGTRVAIDPVGEADDGPLVSIVQVGGTSINYQVVVEGLAWVDRKRCRAVFCRRWYIQEHQAVQARRGIWGLNIGTPPWQWGR